MKRERPETEKRLKQKVVLSEFELGLLEMYKLLESSSGPRAVAAVSDDKAKQKAFLLAQALERERVEAEQRERQKQAAAMRRKRQNPDSEPHNKEDNKEGEAVQIAESVDRTNVAAPPPPKRPSAKPVVAKEWDIDNPGWPFVGLPLHDGVDLAANPHLAQNDVGFFRVPMEMIPKCMHAEMGVKKYTWIAKNKRSTSHAGWKKLIMQEIDFLSEYGERGMLVIYAGAAPGAQFPILTQMFPYLSFVLLDSAQFLSVSSERVQIRHDVTGNPYSDQNLGELIGKPGKKLFISDMHTGAAHTEAEQQFVRADMDRQMIWFRRLGAEHGLLKFRLPWTEGTTTYLTGDQYFSCYGPQTTTETRLLVHKGCDTREYDNKIHEETMFYFNRMVRVQYYEHGVDCPGIDHCFDCARTVQILSNHLTRHDGWFEGVRNAETMKLETELPAEALNAEVKKMILRINEDLDKIRHSKSNQENAELQNDLHQHHQHLQQQQDEAQQHLHHHQQDEAVIVQGGANEEEAEVDYEGL